MEFIEACTVGDVELVKTLESDVLSRHEAMAAAFANNHVHVVEWLTEMYPDTAAPNFDIVCGYGNLEILQYMIDKYPDHCNQFTDLAFMAACKSGHLHVAQWLHIVYPRIANVEKFVDAACGGSYLHIVQWLIEIFSINPHNAIKYTIKSDLVTVRWFLNTYPDINVYDIRAFYWARWHGRHDLVEYLAITFPDICENQDEMMLCHVCCMGDLEKVQHIIVDKTINIHYMSDRLFAWACGYGWLHIAKYLHETYPDICIQGINLGFTLSCNRGFVDVVQWLLDTYDIDIYVQDGEKLCVFHEQAYVYKIGESVWNHLSVVQLLANKYPNAMCDISKYGLTVACKHGNLKVVQWLLKMYPRIDIDSLNDRLTTIAIRSKHMDVLSWLVDQYPSMEIVDICVLVYNNDYKMIDFLVRATENQESYYYLDNFDLVIVSKHAIPDSDRCNQCVHGDYYMYSMNESDYVQTKAHIVERYRQSRIKSANN